MGSLIVNYTCISNTNDLIWNKNNWECAFRSFPVINVTNLLPLILFNNIINFLFITNYSMYKYYTHGHYFLLKNGNYVYIFWKYLNKFQRHNAIIRNNKRRITLWEKWIRLYFSSIIYCSSCHSELLITQNELNNIFW